MTRADLDQTIATWRNFVYVAFVFDTFSRRIVGWPVFSSLRSGLALDAHEQATAERHHETDDALIHQNNV